MFIQPFIGKYAHAIPVQLAGWEPDANCMLRWPAWDITEPKLMGFNEGSSWASPLLICTELASTWLQCYQNTPNTEPWSLQEPLQSFTVFQVWLHLLWTEAAAGLSCWHARLHPEWQEGQLLSQPILTSMGMTHSLQVTTATTLECQVSPRDSLRAHLQASVSAWPSSKATNTVHLCSFANKWLLIWFSTQRLNDNARNGSRKLPIYHIGKDFFFTFGKSAFIKLTWFCFWTSDLHNLLLLLL